MKYFTISQELVVFVSYLFVVGGIRGEKRNRMDAGQDPFETMTIHDDEGPSSTLFASCIAASNTIEAKIYSIEVMHSSNLHSTEFIRHVPDSWQRPNPPEQEWTTRMTDPPVASIADCATVAQNEDYPMFKYSGGDDCKVNNRSYNLDYEPSCEAEEQDAVFISTDADLLCPLPGIQNEKDGVTDCILVHPGPMSMEEVTSFCDQNLRNAGKFNGRSVTTEVDDVVKILQNLKMQSYDFIVAIEKAYGVNYWVYPNITVNVDQMVGTPSTDDDRVMFFSGANEFKFDFITANDYMGGALCVAPDIYG